MNAQEQILKKIIQFQQKNLSFRIIAGVVNLLIYLLLIWLSTFIADSAFYFSTEVRWFILFLNGTLSVFLLYKMIISPLIELFLLSDKIDLTHVTRDIGNLYTSIKDKLTNIYQIIITEPLRCSLPIKEHLIKKFADQVSESDFNEKLRLRYFLLPLSFVLPVLFGSIILVFLSTENVSLSLKRILNPAEEYAIVPWYEFAVHPGDTEIITGNPLEISAYFKGPEINECILRYKNEGEVKFHSKQMRRIEDHYNLRLENIKKPFEYYIQALPTFSAEWYNKLISSPFRVKTLIPPLVNEVHVEVLPPRYTKLERQLLEVNVGDIIAYPGSRVNISTRTNKRLKTAEIAFSDGKKSSGKIRDSNFKASFTVDITKTYILSISDEGNLVNQNPIEYSITVLDDLFPAIDITEPGEDIEITTDGAVSLIIEGNDDFGFRDLQLHYQILGKVKEFTDSTWQHIPISIPTPDIKYFQQSYFWNFSILPVTFDDVVKYYVSLSDNDVVNGPKSSRSSTYYIRFPSIEQLFSEFEKVQDENIEAIEDLNDASEDLKKDLEEIRREMKREKEVDWERKRSLESALEKQNEVREKLDKIEKELEDAISKLEKNQLFSPEILEKYHQIQELFQEIATPELMQAMKDLQKSLENLNQKQAQQSVERFKINQERFKENLDRALALFKKVKLEQELDRLVKMSEALTKEQEGISNKLESKDKLDQNSLQSLIPKEENQKNLLNQINRSLSELMKNNLLQEYPKSSDHLENGQKLGNQIQQGLEDISDFLSQGNQQLAQQNSQQAGQQMGQLQSHLKSAQQNMLQSDQKKIMARMQKITDDLLKLSKDEERLTGDTQKLSDFSNRFPEVASSQMQIIENMSQVTRSIIDLSHETFFLSPQISKSIGSAHGGMRRSMRELENRKQRSATNFQRQSMAGLNETVIQMLNSMEMLANAKSALGFEQYLQQMQKLSNQQGQLNQESLNLFNKNQGTLSIEQQSQLTRMAAEQKAIQKSLEELSNDVQGRSDVLGNLDNMAQEMGEVVNDLQALNLDRKTIERQQKILSRMIDAQKSVREREYSKKRLAEVGKDYVRKSPRKMTDIEDRKSRQLNLDLLRALQEGYNPDYEKLIEEYFRKLNINLTE